MGNVRVVLDSSVIIALSKLTHLKDLRRIFKEILIPVAVYEEICIKGRGLFGDKELREAISEGVILIRGVKNCIMIKELCREVSIGEAEAIVLALEEGVDLIALDDRLARKRARGLGLNVIGTLRILKMFYDRGLMDKQTLILEIRKLKEYGFWISEKVIVRILKEL